MSNIVTKNPEIAIGVCLVTLGAVIWYQAVQIVSLHKQVDEVSKSKITPLIAHPKLNALIDSLKAQPEAVVAPAVETPVTTTPAKV